MPSNLLANTSENKYLELTVCTLDVVVMLASK